jgi:4-aminobutyrate aminotransferase-like enzyme
MNCGTEANDLAMRLAKLHTGNNDMACFSGGYHGNSQSCIDVSSYKFDGAGGRGCPPSTVCV